MAKLIVPTNTSGSTGPLENKVYKKVGQTRITLKQKIEDLKNWFYETYEGHLYDVPKWNDIPFNESHTLFYDDNSRRMSFYVDGTTKYLLIIDMTDNNKGYTIYSENYLTYEANKWYYDYQVVDTPDFVLDDDYLSWDISIGEEPYKQLFDAIYSTNRTLDQKFDEVFKYVDQESLSLLKNKYYDINQTMEQKLEEGIQDWFYSRGGNVNKPLYNILPVFTSDFAQLLTQNNLMPSNNSSISDVTLYYEASKIKLEYGAFISNGTQIFSFHWIDLQNDGITYACDVSFSQGASSVEWYIIQPVEENEEPQLLSEPSLEDDSEQITITQDNLPSFNYNPLNVANGITPTIVTSVITTISNDVTLKQKIADLANWDYEKVVDNSVSGYKPVFDVGSILMDSSKAQAIYEAGLFSNQNNTALYFDGDLQNNNDLEVYWTFQNGVVVIMWKVADDANNTYHVYAAQVMPGENQNDDPVTEWYKYDEPYSDTPTEPTLFTDPDELPILDIDSSFIQSGFEDILPLFYEEVQSQETIISLKDKFRTCLVLERIVGLTITENDLVANDNAYSLSPYLYVWKAQIQDDTFKDALKIETIFDLDQVAAENICPFQDIDTENGVLTLYVKEKNGNIVIDRIDIFKNNN